MAQSLVNEVLNETWTHSCLQFEWFSVGYGFIYRLCSFFRTLISKNCKNEEENSRKIPNKKKNTWLKHLPQKEKVKEKKTNKRKIQNKEKNINKQQTKSNTTTEDIIPTRKQQHMKEKLTLRNTRYIYIGQNIQEQSTSSKKHFPIEKHNKKNHLINYYKQVKWPNY